MASSSSSSVSFSFPPFPSHLPRPKPYHDLHLLPLAPLLSPLRLSSPLKASRSFSSRSSQVRFSVNGVLILAFLWILKAFLEVVCTFGSMVFLSILLVRGAWSGVSYIRNNQYNYMHRIDNDDPRWNGVRPVG
ncbi:hypothetical protein ACMD2_16026 [Ananas comosus]|uniref:Uncharacterized protein n=1 Tax=Ananas comosus TaxID=4615 RepID=A0A199UFK9_ANACO|nr:hypothetical protein ACMD2_16026 [Ananas comosus]